MAKEFTDPLLTRAVAGLQKSMVQGKRELEERKARDRAKAEAAMQKVRGKDYKMPEKSADLLSIEAKIKKEREDEEANAASENRANRVMFDMSQISNIIMMYCTENVGKNIDMNTGSVIMKYFSEKSIELEAQVRRAKASEFQDEVPSELPSAEYVEAMQRSGESDELAPADDA